jgi:glycerol-3-phosphate dehydrogenase (NAD(P)+)
MNVAILGSGAWGSALAIALAQQQDQGSPLGAGPEVHSQVTQHITLWSRSQEWLLHAKAQRTNDRYLPGIMFPKSLALSADPLGAWLEKQDLVVLATPTAALRGMLLGVLPYVGQTPVIWLCKGFESSRTLANSTACEGLLPHEVQAQVAPELLCGVLSGPSFAKEVALGQPTALVASSPHPQVTQAVVDAFHGPHLRIYANPDWVGVEVGGAVKNILAIATGICDGLQLGLNARAALITRGLAEMTRLAMALGGGRETMMGLSGLGDLVLTATGDLSRNRRVGLELAQGKDLKIIMAHLGHVAEGVYSAQTVLQRAQSLGVEMPITQGVNSILQGQVSAQEAMHQLMSRESKSEAI